MGESFVTEIDLSLSERLKSDLLGKGFQLSQPAHTVFQAKGKGVSCTLYLSGKLLVQGKEMGPFIEFYLEPEILGTFDYSYKEVDRSPRIGIDESGKGDFFGPLCVAGVFAGDEQIDKLVEMGVKDSKRMQDAMILSLATKIRKCCSHHVLRLGPPKYNELYTRFQNLNRMLAWGHATVIETLNEKSHCSRVIIDQFASEDVVESALARKGVKVELTQRHRGEEDIVVAAASILARAEFVMAISELEKRFGQTFPKGASPAVKAAGRQFLERYGREDLSLVAKLHFKTTGEL